MAAVCVITILWDLTVSAVKTFTRIRLGDLQRDETPTHARVRTQHKTYFLLFCAQVCKMH